MTMNIIEQLKKDHRQLISVMNKLEKNIFADSSQCDSLFQEFRHIFRLHDDAEDKIVYPALKEYKPLNKLILKGYQAHHFVELGILELRVTLFESESWGPKFLIVKDSILMHMNEEEKQLFPKATKIMSKRELERLGKEVHKLRKETS